MNTDTAVLLTIADQRARIAQLEQENADLRAALTQQQQDSPTE